MADRKAAGKRARGAGQRFERECWHMLRELWPTLLPTRQVVRNTSLKVPDLDGTGCPFWIECGYRTAVDAMDLLPVKWDQAVSDAGGREDARTPLVLVKQARREALVAFIAERLQRALGDALVVRRDAIHYHEWRRWSVTAATPWNLRVVAVPWGEFVRLTDPWRKTEAELLAKEIKP